MQFIRLPCTIKSHGDYEVNLQVPFYRRLYYKRRQRYRTSHVYNGEKHRKSELNSWNRYHVYKVVNGGGEFEL